MRSQRYLLLFVSFFLSTLLSAQVISGDRAAALYPGAVTVRLADDNPVPQYVYFHPAQQFDAPAVFDWLQKYTLLDEHTEFRLLKAETDLLGRKHYRYRQYYRGVPVQAGVLLLHEQNGKITSINGELFALTGTSTTADIDPQDMIGVAIEQNPAELYAWEVGAAHRPGPLAQGPDPQLVWVSEGLTYQKADYKLAYEMDIYALKPHRHRRVWLDATTGRELAGVDRSCNTDTPGTAVTQFSGTRPIVAFETSSGTFESRETGRGNGIETYDGDYLGDYASSQLFTDDDNDWTGEDGKNEGMECHFATEQYYDLLLNEFGRNSIDGTGFALISYTRFQPDFANAFWNGEVATFGSGAVGSVLDRSLASVEVVSHEFTHGLTEFTAGLIYNGESGALNESFSDVFGLYLDWKVRPEVANWLMGEESTSSGLGIRSAEDPNLHENPDTYDGDFWVDGAGVHTNSGVQNHWYHILSVGETGVNDLGNAYEVEGVGIDVATQIAFRNLTVYLTPSSNYADAAFYAQLAATDLYGRCSSIWTSNANAWYAVGVGTPVSNELMADFSANQVVCDIPGEMTFLNTSSYAENAIWDFGDGTTSTEWAPTHTYTATGAYDVSLMVSGCEMGMDTLVREQYILVDPDAEVCDTIVMPAAGVTTLEACNGIILDPGGDSNYDNQTFSTLTITSPQNTPFELELLAVEIEGFYDELFIYDGPDATAPLLDVLSGTNYEVPLNYTTTGGSFTLVFDTDGSVVYSGFILRFSSQGGTELPTAGFSVSDTELELNELLLTTDESLEGGTVWYDFGDGTILFAENTEHRYTVPGDYTITQYVANCRGVDTSFQAVSVLEGGTLSLPTDTICVTLLSGTSLDTFLTIANAGVGDLYYDWFGNNEPDWLTLNVMSGLLDVGEQVDHPISFSTGSLIEGVYTQNVVLNTGDPSAFQVPVHLKLTIIGIPEVSTNPNPQDFGTVFVTVGGEQEFKIYNPGTAALEISSWANSLTEYTFSLTPPLTIPPHDSLTVTTTITPAGLGVLNDVLTMQTNAGTYEHVLLAAVAPAPIANIDSLSICVTLEEGQTADEILTITNTGGSTLNYEWLTNGNVLVWMHGVDAAQEGQTLLDALAAELPGAEINLYTGDSPAELADLLTATRVLVMPESETGSFSVFEAAGPVIRNFVNGGGGLVHTTGGVGDPINNVGVFTGFLDNTSFDSELITMDGDHPLLLGVETPVFALNLTTAYVFDSPNRTDVLALFNENAAALSAQTYGAGRAAYVGYDYFATNSTGDRILANAVNWAGQSSVSGLPDWLTLAPLTGSVEVGGQDITDLAFDATGLPAGIFFTNLVFASNDPANPEIIVEVKLIVEAAPRAEFSASSLFSCDGVIEFTDESINEPTSWLWNFGDGNTSTVMNPIHTYTESGSYDVSLEVCNELGCDDITRPAYVAVDLGGSVCDTLVMQNGGTEVLTNCTGYITDSGGADGNYPNNFASVVTLQPTLGTSVTVTVESFRLEGCCDYVRFYDGPSTASPFIGEYNGFDLQPGDQISSTGDALTIRFTTDFSVTYSGFVFQYECNGIAPIANFEYGVQSECGNMVDFANQSEHGDAYLWEFGDGVTSTQEHPSHAYSAVGNYTVSLTTTNALSSSTHTEEISIAAAPFDLAIDMPAEVDINTMVIFNPITTASLVDYVWELGEGNYFNQETAFYTFTEVGTYPIRLRGVDSDGCAVIVQRDIVVKLANNIEELGPNEYFRYYPNPSQGELLIDLSLSGADVSDLQLFNALGQIVYQQRLDGQAKWQQQLDLSALPAGTYLLQVRATDGRRISGKVQKM